MAKKFYVTEVELWELDVLSYWHQGSEAEVIRHWYVQNDADEEVRIARWLVDCDAHILSTHDSEAATTITWECEEPDTMSINDMISGDPGYDDWVDDQWAAMQDAAALVDDALGVW